MIDTKWKRLDMSRPHENVSQSDVYQMYAYGKEYDLPKVIPSLTTTLRQSLARN